MANSKRVILIIDDDRNVCELIKLRLEAENDYQVFIACDGISGLKNVLGLVPDCVLLDIRMQIGDGLSVLRQIRSYRNDDLDLQERIRSIPVVILTGVGNEMESFFKVEGANDYIEKPFDSSQLKKCLQRVFEGQSRF
jgi:CheY-like chemotaxis protein